MLAPRKRRQEDPWKLPERQPVYLASSRAVTDSVSKEKGGCALGMIPEVVLQLPHEHVHAYTHMYTYTHINTDTHILPKQSI